MLGVRIDKDGQHTVVIKGLLLKQHATAALVMQIQVGRGCRYMKKPWNLPPDILMC